MNFRSRSHPRLGVGEEHNMTAIPKKEVLHVGNLINEWKVTNILQTSASCGSMNLSWRFEACGNDSPKKGYKRVVWLDSYTIGSIIAGHNLLPSGDNFTTLNSGSMFFTRDCHWFSTAYMVPILTAQQAILTVSSQVYNNTTFGRFSRDHKPFIFNYEGIGPQTSRYLDNQDMITIPLQKIYPYKVVWKTVLFGNPIDETYTNIAYQDRIALNWCYIDIPVDAYYQLQTEMTIPSGSYTQPGNAYQTYSKTGYNPIWGTND